MVKIGTIFAKDKKTMAMAISNILVLKGEVEDRFIEMAKQAEKERATIDFATDVLSKEWI